MWPGLLLMGIGGLVLAGGVVAGVLLPPPEGGVNMAYLIPGVVFGTALDLAGAVLLVRNRKAR